MSTNTADLTNFHPQTPTRKIEDYTDIINLPHHQSKIHPPMSLENRAAQFAPYAALTGQRNIVAKDEATAEQSML